MKYTPDPKQKWERKIFDEDILKNLSNRERAEIETNRDLDKPIEQLLCDVHEETHNPGGTELANIACAQKRMVSLMARVAISNDKVACQMKWLTAVIALLTLGIFILTFLLLPKG